MEPLDDTQAKPVSTPGKLKAIWLMLPAPLRKYALHVFLTLLGAGVMALGDRLGVTLPKPPPEVIEVQAEPLASPEAEPFDYHGLRYESQEHSELRFLNGSPEVERASSPRPFPARRITWTLNPAGLKQLNPPLAEDAVIEAFRRAWAAWSAVLDIEPEYVQPGQPCLVSIGFGQIREANNRVSGVGGTLAWSELSFGTNDTLQQMYDVAERWTVGPPARGLVSLEVVAIHEIGHAMCLQHDKSGANAIMAPIYNENIPRPTPRDFDRMVAAGYKRRTVVNPPPGGNDPYITVPAQLRTADVLDALRQRGYNVPALKP